FVVGTYRGEVINVTSIFPNLTSQDGAGADGGAGNDTLYGHDGGDYLVGGPGNDLLYGGDGYDLAAYNFSAATQGISFDASVIGTGTGVTLADGLGGTDALYGMEGAAINGSPFDDSITGGVNGDEIHGGDGNDVIAGGGGSDFMLDGGNGDDVIIGGPG